MKVILDIQDKRLTRSQCNTIGDEILETNDFYEPPMTYDIVGNNSIIIDIEELGMLKIPAGAEEFENGIKGLLVDYYATGRIESSLTGNTLTTKNYGISGGLPTLLAAQIIDVVEDAIYQEHPDLADQMVEKYENEIEEPGIISGEAYYKLEEKISSMLSKYIGEVNEIYMCKM